MNRITKGWHLMRIVRAALALLIIVQGFQVHNYMSLLFGAGFLAMALFDVGCCGAQGCATDFSNSSGEENAPVIFEEVRSPEKKK